MGMIGNSLAQGLISGANIQDGTVDTPDIKDSAVTAAKIASAVVTPAKMDFSAGTANGVLYLNGSKVASSGSALAFDGTNLFVGTTAIAKGTGYPSVQAGYGALYGKADGGSAFIGSNYFLGTGGADSRITTNAVGLFNIITPSNDGARFEWYGAANGGTAGGTVSLATYGVWNYYGLSVNALATVSNVPLSIKASGTASAYLKITAPSGSYDAATFYTDGTNESYCGMMRGSNGGTGNFNVWVNGSVRTTVDTAGRLGIGTASPGYTIHTEGAGTQSLKLNSTASTNYSYISLGAGTMGFQMGVGASGASSNTNKFYMYDERRGVYVAAVDNYGNFYVGNTSGNEYNTAMAGTQPGLQVYGGYSPIVQNSAYATWVSYINSNGGFYMYELGTGADMLILTKTSGNLNIRGAYGYISDRKLKENIVDATPKLADLMRLRVRNYNMIGDDRKMLGLIAQEVEEVFPALIEEKQDVEMGSSENGDQIIDLGTVTKSIKASVLVPMLIKAIQEQQAIIESLTERITALEAN
jgi:hypothetical protein